MNIHEYQAKELFARYGIPVPGGRVALGVDEAVAAGGELGYPVVVKAQIHAGGRGKGGGVRPARNEAALREAASAILGMTLVTRQTGPAGRVVRRLLIEKAVEIESELYVAILIDRAAAAVTIMASRTGGMDIEEAAARSPGAVVRVPVHPLTGLRRYHCRELARGLRLPPALDSDFCRLLSGLYRLFRAHDCSLVEINPLVLTAGGRLIALDAKIVVDDNALFRQEEIRGMRDPAEDDPLEARAAAAGLNYIRLDGDIGAMVNGAGLAMATMDMIQAAGARPANFLDVGGGASAEMVRQGFSIILSDPNVKGILVNIFGGILRCDVLAEGIVAAAEKMEVRVPVVVRMEGTNVAQGRAVLAGAGLALRTAADLEEAARLVAAIGGES